MSPQIIFEQWKISPSTGNVSVGHTWIRSWDLDLDPLRTEVTAAGWQWHTAQRNPDDEDLVAALCHQAGQRYRDMERYHQQLQDGGAGRPAPALPPLPVMLAVGPEFNCVSPELMWLARLGRAARIHLAVASTHLNDLIQLPAEFRDNICGWYQGSAIPGGLPS